MVLLQVLSDTATDDTAFSLFEKLSPKFFIRLGIDIVSVFVLIRFIYYPAHKSREYFFTFFIFKTRFLSYRNPSGLANKPRNVINFGLNIFSLGLDLASFDLVH